MPGIGSFTRERTPRSAAAEPGAAPLNAKQQAMVRSVMALVRKFARARRRRSPGVAYDELVAGGYQVLVELAPRYDETRGPFAVFATFRVKGAMLKYVRATLEQRGAEREIRAGSSRTMRTRGMDLLTGKPDDEQIDGAVTRRGVGNSAGQRGGAGAVEVHLPVTGDQRFTHLLFPGLIVLCFSQRR